jgi:hypothetical protein
VLEKDAGKTVTEAIFLQLMIQLGVTTFDVRDICKNLKRIALTDLHDE